MSQKIKERFPNVNVATGDCQERLPFPNQCFDRIIAIHVLEHLPNLPGAVREAHRLCKATTGRFLVVIPCEGSPAYLLARRFSAQRIFEKRYGQSYDWFIKREHINRPNEILDVLDNHFTIEQRTFFPIPLPFVFCNLVIGLTLRPKQHPRE